MGGWLRKKALATAACWAGLTCIAGQEAQGHHAAGCRRHLSHSPDPGPGCALPRALVQALRPHGIKVMNIAAGNVGRTAMAEQTGKEGEWARWLVCRCPAALGVRWLPDCLPPPTPPCPWLPHSLQLARAPSSPRMSLRLSCWPSAAPPTACRKRSF